MGQQQLLLIVLGTIIVGVAVVVGINMFSQGAVNAERDALVQDVNMIGAKAAEYWRKPAEMGGGARDFTGVTFAKLGADASNANGTYVLAVVDADSITVTGTGANEGVTVRAGITEDGVSGAPTITLP
ncbi:MAG: hypothetical protein COT43_08525 [Candidatus Marinimicrobia bacterium CG08_land_8_20_14_0_20_45_22]|nr:MAG: hypothetical protein COT43_08525 [Candidatus Marinimicrobia bacterium CG08_land_8_20_14_0_20_45_22]